MCSKQRRLHHHHKFRCASLRTFCLSVQNFAHSSKMAQGYSSASKCSIDYLITQNRPVRRVPSYKIQEPRPVCRYPRRKAPRNNASMYSGPATPAKEKMQCTKRKVSNSCKKFLLVQKTRKQTGTPYRYFYARHVRQTPRHTVIRREKRRKGGRESFRT